MSFTATLGQGPGPGNAPGQGPGPLRTSIESLNKRLANSNENGQGYIGLGGVDHNAQGGGVGVQVPLASLGGHAEKKPHTHLSSAMALVFGEKAAPVITQTAENVAYALLDIDLSEPRPLPATTLGPHTTHIHTPSPYKSTPSQYKSLNKNSSISHNGL